MVWNKLKKQLESFLSPVFEGRLGYLASGYRYTPEKSGHCFITLDKMELFNMKDKTSQMTWYQNEQEVKGDANIEMAITSEALEALRSASDGKIPEDRLLVIAKDRKLAQYAKDLMTAQNNLLKTDFKQTASAFLSDSIENSLRSDDIILNVLALVDRRVGKKRLIKLSEEMKMKHPVVKKIYDLRVGISK